MYIVYCIFDNGFILNSFLRTTIDPKKWYNKGSRNSQARVLFLFDQIPRKYYICYLDNIFMSAHILRTAYVDIKSKVKMHFVTGK